MGCKMAIIKTQEIKSLLLKFKIIIRVVYLLHVIVLLTPNMAYGIKLQDRSKF